MGSCGFFVSIKARGDMKTPRVSCGFIASSKIMGGDIELQRIGYVIFFFPPQSFVNISIDKLYMDYNELYWSKLYGFFLQRLSKMLCSLSIATFYYQKPFVLYQIFLLPLWVFISFDEYYCWYLLYVISNTIL